MYDDHSAKVAMYLFILEDKLKASHRRVIHCSPGQANVFLRHAVVKVTQRSEAGVYPLDLQYQRGYLFTGRHIAVLAVA